jgi:hypothetical protein
LDAYNRIGRSEVFIKRYGETIRVIFKLRVPRLHPIRRAVRIQRMASIIRTRTSDTPDPFQVDNGAVAVTPIGDETSAPISVDAT